MNMEKKYTYLVAFNYKNGFGNFFVIRSKKISTMNDVLDIQKGIEREYGIQRVAVINFILLEDETDYEN